MRKIFFIAIITSFGFFACKKTDISLRTNTSLRPASTPLDGTWRMILVTDIASGLTTTKPASIPNDVDITFTSINPGNGTFTGITPTNQIWENEYSTGAGQELTIPSLGITKAWETDWGFLFVGNIRFSVSYNLEAVDILNITTTDKILRFHKLP